MMRRGRGFLNTTHRTGLNQSRVLERVMTRPCTQEVGGSTRRAGLRVDPRIAWQQVEGQVVLLDLSDGTAIGLNPAASHIWSMLEDHDEDAVIASVIETFEVSSKTARADVRRFVDECLESSYLLRPDAADRK